MVAYPEYVIHGYEPTPVFSGTPKSAAGAGRDTAEQGALLTCGSGVIVPERCDARGEDGLLRRPSLTGARLPDDPWRARTGGRRSVASAVAASAADRAIARGQHRSRHRSPSRRLPAESGRIGVCGATFEREFPQKLRLLRAVFTH